MTRFEQRHTETRVGFASGTRPSVRGFTLIELLVVISIIALLIGILLPALGTARSVARSVVCQATARQLALAQYSYTLDEDDWYAAPASSGAFVGLRGLSVSGGVPSVGSVTEVEFDTTGTTPVSAVDWISPSLGLAVELPANRALRTQTILNNFGCAAAGFFNDTIFPGGSPGDTDQFEDLLVQGGFQQVSYLMPLSMGTFSNDLEGVSPLPGYIPPGGFDATDNVTSGAVVNRNRSPAVTPESFRPRLDRVGTQLSNKILFADGTRLYRNDGLMNIDIDTRPNFFGFFTSSTPFFQSSSTYGRTYDGGPDGAPNQLPLVYRHPRSSINAGFFDGHVENISQSQSYTDPNPWFPTGSVWVDEGTNTPESNEFVEQQRRSNGDIVIY